MKYIFLLMLFASCATKKSQEVPICSPAIRIEISDMNNYMNVLPFVLDFSKIFRNLPDTDKLSDREFNIQFYKALFNTPMLSLKLREAGFSTPMDFAQFHETVLDLFLFLTQEEFSIKSAEQENLELQKQIDKLKLKTAREPHNHIFKKSLSELICQETSFHNILVVNQFKKDLDQLNKNAGL